jgi:hypothetical protein
MDRSDAAPNRVLHSETSQRPTITTAVPTVERNKIPHI